ncbi:MAG: hypothetical protein JWO28_2224 [Hyphomicrobiales bacterium]|nr:hypothetical protein [Hyphomicrobiales bacterium]
MGTILFYLFLAYAGIGIIIAAGFVLAGVSHVLPGTSMTIGARLLIVPGAIVLWPYVLRRWIAGPQS